MNLTERMTCYNNAFPKYPPLVVHGRWLYGVWMLGNNYKGSGLYGAYPPSYLNRISKLFPECDRILHLFSGSLPPGNYVRVDLHDGDVEATAEQLPFGEQFDLIYADPPYSVEDAEHYQAPMINRTKVLAECVKICRPGGFVVWLDQVLPMHRKIDWDLLGTIGIIRSTNHRVRFAFIFQKKKKSP